MNPSPDDRTPTEAATAVEQALSSHDLPAITTALHDMGTVDAVRLLERLGDRDRAIVYRLLPKDTALSVFEALDASLQGHLVQSLQAEDVATVFADMDPDDRVSLLDELPATVATRLLQGLPVAERDLTSLVLGYPQGSIGRRMSPEYLATHPHMTATQTLDRVRDRLDDAETVYTLAVTDRARRVVGIVSLRDLMRAPDSALVADLMHAPQLVRATDSAEAAARRCADLRLLALPVVDAEGRLVGVLTVDDALTIVEDAESEDHARIGGSEPLRRPYLSTPVRSIVRSRVVWLLVLGVGATLTVQVLEVFEQTLEQMVVLSLFIPLLIGTGGNTGNQAATTITRALALDDVRPRDIFLVLAREVRVGLSLGLLLGSVGFAFASWAYGADIGAVVGLTLIAVCTMAATVGGAMPIIGRKAGVDPAVFSNPFITTFIDATGLLVYFVIARAVLGL